MKNWLVYKIYIFSVIIVSLMLIGLNILAQVQETPEVLKSYIGGENCPNFSDSDSDINQLTMKDECTGLVWARHELPTYYETSANLDSQGLAPGYDWQQAVDGCANLSPAGMFRLPTVEELLSLVKYQCDANGCRSSLERSDEDGTPFFSYGIYWSINDFNEDPAWRNPNAVPPGKEIRDYKRSVNLTNGEVDSPVFNKAMRLNAWCVVNRTPEILEKKFINANIQNITNGQAVNSGTLKTVYNRKCNDYTADCITEQGDIIGTYCDASGFCAQDENQSITARVVNCSGGYHVEGNTCVANPNAPTATCPTPEIEAQGISAKEVWKGNIFNGYRICRVENCPNPTNYHVDPETELCVSNQLSCNLGISGICLGGDNDGVLCTGNDQCPGGECINWIKDAAQVWNTSSETWGDCQVNSCYYDADPLAVSCQCDLAGGKFIRDGYCTTCPAGNHLDISGICVSNIGEDCSTPEEVKIQVWQGGLIDGYYECTFQNCQPGYHESEDTPGLCISDDLSCTLGTDVNPYNWVASAQQIWNDITNQWSDCTITGCSLPTSLNNGICTCPDNYVIREDGTCTLCGNGVVDESANEQCDTGCTLTQTNFGTESICDPVPLEQPTVNADILYIVDTSPSLDVPITNLCSIKSTIADNLVNSNINTKFKIYGISDSDSVNSPNPNGGCNASISSTVLNYIYNDGINSCVNVYDTTCNTYDKTDCDDEDACLWTGTYCKQNNDYCSSLDKDSCDANTSKCDWIRVANGCGNGYVFYGHTYPNDLNPQPDLITNTNFCAEDWVSSSLQAINEYSNNNGTLDWTPDSERMLILVFDEAPYTGGDQHDITDWSLTDYQHMQSSLRTVDGYNGTVGSGQSLIQQAKNNNVKISIIFTDDLNNVTDTACSGWDFTTVTGSATPNAAADLDQNKYCALKKIVDSTGGVFQNGSSIMTNTNTASNISKLIKQALVTEACDNDGVPDGIMDCQSYTY